MINNIKSFCIINIYIYIYYIFIDAEPETFIFGKKIKPEPKRDSSLTSPSRTGTLSKRTLAELRHLQDITGLK